MDRAPKSRLCCTVLRFNAAMVSFTSSIDRSCKSAMAKMPSLLSLTDMSARTASSSDILIARNSSARLSAAGPEAEGGIVTLGAAERTDGAVEQIGDDSDGATSVTCEGAGAGAEEDVAEVNEGARAGAAVGIGEVEKAGTETGAAGAGDAGGMGDLGDAPSNRASM